MMRSCLAKKKNPGKGTIKCLGHLQKFLEHHWKSSDGLGNSQIIFRNPAYSLTHNNFDFGNFGRYKHVIDIFMSNP